MITRFEFDDDIHLYPDILDFVTTKVPPDDTRLVINKVVAGFMIRMQQLEFDSYFQDNNKVILLKNEFIETVGYTSNAKIMAICALAEHKNEIFKAMFRTFYCRIYMGTEDEMDEYISQYQDVVDQHVVVEVDDGKPVGNS